MSQVHLKVSPPARTPIMHRKAVASRTVGDSPSKRIRLGEGEIVSNDGHPREIHANFSELRQSGFRIVYHSRLSRTFVPGRVGSVRLPFSVDVGIVVLHTGRQRDEFFRRTCIHTMTVDLHWCVTLWSHINGVLAVCRTDARIFQT